LNTVYGAIFGKFLDPHDESFQEFQKLIKIFFDYLLYLILIGNMFNSNKFMMRLFASRGVNARLKTETIVKQWMINNKNEKKSNDDNTKETVLTRMLEYQSQNYDVVDDDLIISDFTAMMLAASDTTQSHLEQSIVHLCLYPEIQEVVYNELNGVFDKHEEFSLKKVQHCHKFRAFVQEIIRLSQLVVLTLTRYLYQDVTINLKESCGIDKEYFVPKHTTIFANIYAINQERPEFNIAHFLNDKGEFEANEDLFLTFGTGKRECIGRHLAIKEIYLILGILIRKYKFQCPNNDMEAFEKTMCQHYGPMDAYKTPVEVVRR